MQYPILVRKQSCNVGFKQSYSLNTHTNHLGTSFQHCIQFAKPIHFTCKKDLSSVSMEHDIVYRAEREWALIIRENIQINEKFNL